MVVAVEEGYHGSVSNWQRWKAGWGGLDRLTQGLLLEEEENGVEQLQVLGEVGELSRVCQ